MGEKEHIWSLYRVLKRLKQAWVSAIPTGELSRGAFFCLGALCHSEKEHPGEEGVRVWELAERTHVRPPAVSRTLRELEERGLIERSVDRADRRNIKVRPTAEGLRFGAETEARMADMIRRVENRMGASDMAQLAALCDRLSHIMEEEGDKQAHA